MLHFNDMNQIRATLATFPRDAKNARIIPVDFKKAICDYMVQHPSVSKLRLAGYVKLAPTTLYKWRVAYDQGKYTLNSAIHVSHKIKVGTVALALTKLKLERTLLDEKIFVIEECIRLEISI